MKTTIIAITGPSGFRKGELLNRALKTNENFVKLVSYTDRPMREGEVDGVDFHFVDEDKFTSMIEAGKFVEWQRLLSNGYRYGKTKEDLQTLVETHKDQGKVIFTEVNIINLPVFKRFLPELKSIFVDVADTKALIEYLRNNPEIEGEDIYEKRYNFATEERRRRHLTDFIMNMKEGDVNESLPDFLALVDKCIELNQQS